MQENPNVFFIGDVALDEYYRAPYFPKLKEKIIVHTMEPQMGGMIANAACVFAGYGMPASFLTALNSGPTSKALCCGLEMAGLDTAHMVWDDSLPDAKTIIILAEEEHTVFIPTLGLERMELPPETFSAITAADCIYSTFCELRPLRHGALDAGGVLSAFRQQGGKLWCDLDVADIRDEDEALFQHVDTLFVNEGGYTALTRRAGCDAADWLFHKGVGLVVVTLAGDGCRVMTPDGNSIRVPGIQVPVADVTGAGDTFCASFLYAWCRTGDLGLCAEFANVAAARAVTLVGARAGAAGLSAVVEFARSNGMDPGRFEALAKQEVRA